FAASSKRFSPSVILTAELVKRMGLSICLPRQCLIGRQFHVGGVAKCRQARMKIARHGAAAECRVGKRDDLSPALAGRLNHSLQKSPSSERSERFAALQCAPPNTYLVVGIPLPLRVIGI